MTLSKDIVKFNSHTSARDKIFRIIQYGSRLALWQLTHGSPTIRGDNIDNLRKLEVALGLSRKLFRMGNVIDLVHKTLDAFSSPNSMLKVLAIVTQAFKGLWLALDHLLWFRKVELVKVDLAFWSKWSLRAWLVALVSASVADKIKLNIIQGKMDKHRKEQGDKVPYSGSLQIEMHSARMNFWRDFCDLFIPLGGLGYVSPGIGALCGTVSSFIGFGQEWEKHISAFQPSPPPPSSVSSNQTDQKIKSS